MIYLERPGADVGWTTSPGWLDRIETVARVAVKAAKVIIAL